MNSKRQVELATREPSRLQRELYDLLRSEAKRLAAGMSVADRRFLRALGSHVIRLLEAATNPLLLAQSEGQDVVRLTSLGYETLSRGEEDEPSKDVLRVFVSVLTLRYPPSWVAYWQGSPDSLDLVLPDSERQVLAAASIGAGLTVDDLETWAWWDALERVPQGEETAAHRKALGDAGEELTLNYERARLKKEGFPELSARVRWVARESAAYGFDVLSFFGASFGADNPEERLAIEVKANALKARPAFHLFLTDHEWSTACRLGRSYIFHLWDGVSAQPQLSSARKSPVVLTSGALHSHLPPPPSCGEACRWKSTFILLCLQE